MARIAKVEYDRDLDIMYVSVGKKASDSLEVDKFVIDFAGNDVVGVEIFDASKTINGLSQSNLSKSMIGELHDAKMVIHRSKELSYLVLLLYKRANSRSPTISISVPAPRMAMTMHN